MFHSSQHIHLLAFFHSLSTVVFCSQIKFLLLIRIFFLRTFALFYLSLAAWNICLVRHMTTLWFKYIKINKIFCSFDQNDQKIKILKIGFPAQIQNRHTQRERQNLNKKNKTEIWTTQNIPHARRLIKMDLKKIQYRQRKKKHKRMQFAI